MSTKVVKLETLHTPGPWFVHTENDCSSIESNSGTIATVMGDNCDCDEQIAADARLLAAAPLLLEHLRDLVEAFPEGAHGIEAAGAFGADAHLQSARILLHQLDNDEL